jgi:hypothetical protein
METGKNSVIYVGLILGPNKTHQFCRKTIITGTMHRGFTVDKNTITPNTLAVNIIQHISNTDHHQGGVNGPTNDTTKA